MGGPIFEDSSNEFSISSIPPSSSPTLPCPGFEGFEKRLEVEFYLPESSAPDNFRLGLRTIPRTELDSMLDAARCTIVSQLSNSFFDSYVLSESSLFVYPKKAIIKTCGTTRLLELIPRLLESAAKIGMKPRRCRYSRGSFIFPEAQPAPYNDFNTEAKYLNKYFGDLSGGSKAYVLGDALKTPNWHIYVADDADLGRKDADVAPTYTLEMCMTQLDRDVATKFYADAGFKTSQEMTRGVGINGLLPNSEVCDFMFEPCGYSMNSIERDMHSTIHVTPEDGFSYASFETEGYGNSDADLGALIERVLKVFRPGQFSIALHVDGALTRGAARAGSGSFPGTWGGYLPVLGKYVCENSSKQALPMDSAVVFHNFYLEGGAGRSVGGDANELSLPMVEVTPHPLFETVKGHTDAAVKGDCLKGNLAAAVLPAFRGLAKCESGGLFVNTPPVETFHKYGDAPAAVVASCCPVAVGGSTVDVDNFVRRVITATGTEDAFYVMDVAEVLRLWDVWTCAMPRVRPYYAVKCNSDPTLLSLLASLGAGFDVASKAEIDAVLMHAARGTSSIATAGRTKPDMIFANPCKLPSHIRAARQSGVFRTTFDSETELIKLKKHFPDVEAVLRFRADDKEARCPLGVKYGAEIEECEALLRAAKRLGVRVVGVAFHVGSGASSTQAFIDGIADARRLFDLAEKDLGMSRMSLVDIGGGFTSKGGSGVSFKKAAKAISEALERHFPDRAAVEVIGEPGRFFAEAPFTLATHVFGKRVRGKGAERKMEYWINDGIYGSMNCLLYDHAEISCRSLQIESAGEDECSDAENVGEAQRVYKSTIFGPTCDGLDTLLRDQLLPSLQCGDWLIFPRMGAYTQAAGSSFNGFSTSDIKTIYTYSSPSSSSPNTISCGESSDEETDESCYMVRIGGDSSESSSSDESGSDSEDGKEGSLAGFSHRGELSFMSLDGCASSSESDSGSDTEDYII